MNQPVIEHVRTITVDLDSRAFEDKAPQDTPMRVSCFFPNARGVVEMIASDGMTVLLAATGHIRSFIAQRMNEDGEPSSKANLAPITTKIIAYPTGSAFESDWIVLERARIVDNDLYTKLNEQNRRSMLVLDRTAGIWRVEDTLSLRVSVSEKVVGPMQTKKAAAALGEALDDVFELCRYPKELALFPHGTACAYKEMGRCPGVCDGSESIESYRGRFDLAINAAAIGVDRWKEETKDEIKLASEAMEFEDAQVAKRRLDQIEKLPMDTLGFAKEMSSLRCVCITPSVRKGWAMVWIFDCHGLIPALSMREGFQTGDTMISQWVMAQEDPIGFEQLWLDRFALFARHWMTKPSKARRRRVTVLDMRDPQMVGRLEKAFHQGIVDACMPVDIGHDDEEHTHIKGI